jgi:hypothetical protein
MALLMMENPNFAMLAPFPEKATAMSFAPFVWVNLQAMARVAAVLPLFGLTP